MLGRAQILCDRLREQGGDIKITRQSFISAVIVGIGVVSKHAPASRCTGPVSARAPPRHRASGPRWGDGCQDAGDVANKPRTRGETRRDARPINVSMCRRRDSAEVFSICVDSIRRRAARCSDYARHSNHQFGDALDVSARALFSVLFWLDVSARALARFGPRNFV